MSYPDPAQDEGITGVVIGVLVFLMLVLPVMKYLGIL